jgi:uncharacterized membrane protein
MNEWLVLVAKGAVTMIHAIALVIVVVGTIQAFFRSIRVLIRHPAGAGIQFREVHLQYARWLVGALTFQLAADIIESSIVPSWDELGRLGAIAVIRTLLNYFLERDLAELERHEARS